MRRLALPVLFLAFATVFAACGGGESDEDQITDAIVTLAMNSDPANCEELATLSFLEQVEQEEGRAAIEECEEDAQDPSNDAETVDVTDVEVDGSDATATVAFEGGGLDGQTVSVALVEEDGSWKLDEIERFVKLDRQPLLDALEEGVTEASEEDNLEGIDPDCMIERIEDFTDAELEETVLSPTPEPLFEAAEACL